MLSKHLSKTLDKNLCFLKPHSSIRVMEKILVIPRKIAQFRCIFHRYI